MIRTSALVILAALAAGCQADSTRQVLQTANTQAAQRAISTRYFETEDRAAVFSAVLAALQDLEFVIDSADSDLGSVSATRFGGGVTRFTVTVRRGKSGTTIVRASGQANQSEISTPEAFQRFFDALGQSLFLQPHQV
ncbi:hypothetical protein ACQ5SO_03535 [Rhodovulum sp. DZ06]|uniref:hypothetical protein n=1 Tax=Rhodovulum sp. DZ06 TaxID=3425126 RepID=UPI003D330DE2